MTGDVPDDGAGVEQRRDLFIEYQVAEEGFYQNEVEQMLADGEIEVPEWWYEIDLPTCEYTECDEEATKKFKNRHGTNGPYSVSKRCPSHYPEWKGTGGVEWEKDLATEPTIEDKTEQQTLVTDGGTKYSVGSDDREGRTWTRDKRIVLGSWTSKPFMGHRHRHERVEHRLVVEYTHGVGVDILHQARSDDTDKFADDWQAVETMEVREWGMRHERRENAGWLK